MSTATTIHSTLEFTASPKAQNAASAQPSRLKAVGRVIWKALEDMGRRRAAQQMRYLAPRDHAAEAEAVRTLAGRYRATDPGFANDLYAAANRHELQGHELQGGLA